MAGDASSFRNGSGEGLSEPVMECPGGISECSSPNLGVWRVMFDDADLMMSAAQGIFEPKKCLLNLH